MVPALGKLLLWNLVAKNQRKKKVFLAKVCPGEGNHPRNVQRKRSEIAAPAAELSLPMPIELFV